MSRSTARGGRRSVKPFLLNPPIVEEDVKLSEPFSEDMCKGMDLPTPKRFCGEVAEEIDLADPFRQEDTPLRAVSPSESTSSGSSEAASASSAADDENSSKFSSDDDSEVRDIRLEDPFEYGPCDGDTLGKDSDKKLFDSSNVSVIQAVAILFSWFSAYPGISQEAFSRLLYLLHTFLLPTGNNLPRSYYKAHAMISESIVPVQEFHCCVNDCLLFRNSPSGQYENEDVCPKCGEARYEPRSKIPRKKFKYIPLTSRIHRMFRNRRMSEVLQNHMKESGKDSGTIMADVHQSPAWTATYDENGPFQGDPRGISLALCTDGMNPFSKMNVTYSMWPIVLTVLNLPRHLRNLGGSMLLAGIIPGRSEPKNMDPYLDVLVDELIQMNGLQVLDAYREETFELKAQLLLHVLDYPGQNKVFHTQGAGAYAGCTYCTHIGQYAKHLQKMVYPGSRRFLSQDDPRRMDSRNFPSHSSANDEPPQMKTTDFVGMANCEYETSLTSAEKKRIAQRTGCKGSYSLRRLPFHDHLLDTPVDPMHLIKNIVEHTVNLVAGREDSSKVRKQEQECMRFSSAWMKEGSNLLQKAPFALSKEEIVLADERAKSVHTPAGFDWRPRALFGNPTGMKSHEWKEVATSGILKFCLRGMLGSNQRRSLYKLYDVLTDLCSEDIDSRRMDELESNVHEALVCIERDFPLSLQVIVFHLLHHLPMFVRRFGPVYGFWMYPFERFNSWIARRVTNRRYPEATVVETYRLSEWAHFMEISEQLPNGATSALLEEQGNSIEVLQSGCCKAMQLTNEQVSELEGFYTQFDQEQTDTCISSCAGLRSQYTYHDHHRRTVKLTTTETELEQSHSRSYVSIAGTDGTQVGCIISIFNHDHASHTTTFAEVSWFDGPITDRESKLCYVLTTAQSQSVVPIISLSRPLITAFDEHEPGKLWVLNLVLS